MEDSSMQKFLFRSGDEQARYFSPVKVQHKIYIFFNIGIFFLSALFSVVKL